MLVIVDHFSEVERSNADAIRPEDADFPVAALVVTSRDPNALEAVPKSTARPLRIEGNRLSSFVEAYLTQRGKRTLFDDPEFFEICRRLSRLASGASISALFTRRTPR